VLQSNCFEPHDDVVREIGRTAGACASDGPPTCGLCGRRLLPGERPASFACGRETLIVCPTCESAALAQGFVRVAPETSTQRPGDAP